MTMGIPYDCDEGRALGGAITAIMTGVSYATSAEMAGELGPFPDYAKNAQAHAARHPQPSPRRARRGGGLRGPGDQPGAARPRLLPGRGRSSSTPRRAWDLALALGETARLPQRAGHRDRADRHDRPGDGLRHHRHRARFRAGEVQEARRRRLLQDHQPRRARRPAHARLPRDRDRRDRGLRGRPRHPEPGARRSTPTRLRAKGFTRREDRRGREGPEERLRHQVRVQQMDARRGLPDRRRSRSRPSSSTIRPSTCSPSSASRRPTSRPPTSTSAAR